MKHFCVMHAGSGAHYYPCIESQCKTCSRYQTGAIAPRFPVPAVSLVVKYDYIGCVNIDTHQYGEDDPVIVYMYDSWSQQEVT